MDQTSKIPLNQELRKTRSKNIRKTNENNLMVQLHHFANVTKSTTATKARLNLTSESKALLENDYFKLINSKQLKNAEFVAKPFVINENVGIGADFGNKIRCTVSSNNNNNITKHFCHTKKEFKDLVATKFKTKRLNRSPLADACRNINSMISIKDYHSVYCKQIFESRLFINGLLVYDHLKRHYSGVSVARNCFKKKFINKLDKATRELFPEIEPFKTTNNKENRLLQNVMEYYDNEETDVNCFNEQFNRIQENLEKNTEHDEIILECDEVIDNRPITPVSEYLSPESFGTPPDQSLIPVDLTASASAKYRTVIYEKDAKSGKASLFELPDDFTVTGKNVDKMNRADFKRIDFDGASLGDKSGWSPAGSSNDLELVCNLKRLKRSAKKRLFRDYIDENVALERKLDKNGNFDENANFALPNDDVFVRPIYSPREFTAFKRNHSTTSPRKFPQLQPLKVDEFECMRRRFRKTPASLENIAKIKTPEHRYYPFVQFTRE